MSLADILDTLSPLFTVRCLVRYISEVESAVQERHSASFKRSSRPVPRVLSSLLLIDPISLHRTWTPRRYIHLLRSDIAETKVNKSDMSDPDGDVEECSRLLERTKLLNARYKNPCLPGSDGEHRKYNRHILDFVSPQSSKLDRLHSIYLFEPR